MTSNYPVSLVTEIPADLHKSMQNYLNNHPEWDQDRLITAGISLFLLQNWGSNMSNDLQDYRRCGQIYLESLFQEKTPINSYKF